MMKTILTNLEDCYFKIFKDLYTNNRLLDELINDLNLFAK